DLGSRFSLHSGAPGKALLAFLPKPESDQLLSQLELKRYTDRTITTVEELQVEIARIRELGYATDFGEDYEGCNCVGTVIKDHRDYPIAMIWATGTSFSISEDRFAEVGNQLKAAAARISAKFGYQLHAAD
ncbi:MAG: IclR family transcriptional regulator, partial [Coraliomargarita sp.]